MECLINPERGRGEEPISGTTLICLTPNEALALGRNAEEAGWRRQPLYHSARWSPPVGGGALCGPALGAPMAVLTLEKMIALGGRRFVVFGSCGALAPGLRIGDLLLPTWAVSQEGTSRHYPLSATPAVSSSLRTEVSTHLSLAGLSVHEGGVWTTDAPYRETREMIRRFRGLGVTAVEMELSALLTVAAFRHVELAAVLVVSDLLSEGGWQAGFASKLFKTAMRGVGRSLFTFCRGKDTDG